MFLRKKQKTQKGSGKTQIKKYLESKKHKTSDLRHLKSINRYIRTKYQISPKNAKNATKNAKIR